MDEEETYGINKVYGHPRAVELIPDDFFWDCTDEIAPFGSDEGDTALEEYRQWRKSGPGRPLLEFLKETIQEIGEMRFEAYTTNLLDRHFIKQQLADEGFDFHYYVITLDMCVIATGFGQLADEGKIDADAKPVISIALERQLIVNSLSGEDKGYHQRYSENLLRLKETLEKA